MNKKTDYRILEKGGLFYIERKVKVKEIATKGFFKDTYKEILKWSAVDKCGNKLTLPNLLCCCDAFKTIEKAKFFINKICEERKYHYPFK